MSTLCWHSPACGTQSHLIVIHDLGELLPPEDDGVIQRQADRLQEQAVLLAAAVEQLVIGPQPLVELTHAGWERLGGELRMEGGWGQKTGSRGPGQTDSHR